MALGNKGIYCIEGMWSTIASDRVSVQPILELIEASGTSKTVYKSCHTIEELEFLVKKWKTKLIQTRYPILYFAFHGEQGCLLLGRKQIPLEQLGDMLEGKAHGKIFFFASCKTLDIDERKIKSFLVKTQAIAALGYKMDVDWMQATAFELLILDALQVDEFDTRGVKRIKEFIYDEYGNIARRQQFRMVINDRMKFPRKRAT